MNYLLLKMISNITIFNFGGGNSPYDIYACDITNTYCYLISGSTTFPITFNLPIPLNGVDEFMVKVIDTNGCERFKILSCLTDSDTCLIMTEDSFDIYTEDGFGLQMEYCPPDPTPTPTPVISTCYCIGMMNTGLTDGSFTYTNCDGIIISGNTVNPGITLYVCGSGETDIVDLLPIIGSPCVGGSCV